MKIGILGTGYVAGLLAAAWAKAGHEVTLGSRDPEAKALDFPVATLEQTVAGADVVVNALLGSVALEVISGVDAAIFADRTVLDVANATTPSFELVYPNSSLAEHLQAALPDARIVKSLNTAAMTLITDPAQIGTSTVFLSGDDDTAKAEASGLIRDLGWPRESILDLGGIATARGPEHYIVLFSQLGGALKTGAFNIDVVR